MPNKSGPVVLKSFIEVVLELGIWPQILSSDMGKEFMNMLFQELIAVYGCQQKPPLAYTPKLTGIIEGSHKVMETLAAITLWAFIEKFPGRWGRLLPFFQKTARQRPYGNSDNSPYSLGHGFVAMSPLEWTLQPEEHVPPQLVVSDVIREWITSVRQIIKEYDGYRDSAIQKLQETFDAKQKEKVLQVGEVVMLDLPRALKGTSATLSPAFCGPYEVATLKSTSIAKLAQIPEGPELRETGWVSVDRLVKYPWPLDRQLVVDAAPLEGWSWTELFAEEAEPTRKSVLRRRESVRAQNEIASASLGEAVAGFWQSNLGNLAPDREGGQLKFRGLYRTQDGLLTVWPTDRPCLARIVGSRMLGVVPLESDGTLKPQAKNLIATRGLMVNVVQPHSAILQEPEKILTSAECTSVDGIPPLEEGFRWPDRSTPEYGKELVRLLEEKRSSEYLHLRAGRPDVL